MGKKKYKNQRVCVNYARPCSLAGRCANCKHRAMRRDGSIACKLGHDVNGNTDHCFVCTSEGSRCKNDD